jgi:PAS domain S-box-containing protein
LNANAPHEHICLIDENADRPLQPLGQIVAEKLEAGYRCVCLLAEHGWTDYYQSLAEAGVDADAAHTSDALVCFPLNMLLAEAEDPTSMILELIRRECAFTGAAGFAGILFWLDMGGLPASDISPATIEDLLTADGQPERVSVVCAYDRTGSAPERILEALHHHPFIYLDRRVRPNPLFDAPRTPNEIDHPSEALDEFLGKLRDEGPESVRTGDRTVEEAVLFDAIPDPFFTVDHEQRFLHVNATARHLWPRWRDDLIGTSIWDAFPDAVGIFGYEQIQQAIEDRQPRQFEIDSSYLGYWTEVRVLPFRDGLAITYRDISQRKATEAALANRALQQAAVAELGRLALSGHGHDRLLQEAVSAIGQTLDVDYVNVLEMAPRNSGFRLVAGSGWHEGLVGSLLVESGAASLAELTLLVGEPVIVEDLTQETRFRSPEYLINHGVRSGISVVIGGLELPYGVLGAHSRRMLRFSQDDVYFLQAVANILGTAFDHNRTEQLLRHHTAIVMSSEDAIIGESLDGIITSWNESAQRMFGYTEDEALGQPITIIYPPDNYAGAYEVLERIKQGLRIEQMETIRRRKNGELFDASISVSPIRDTGGRIVGAAKIERDISDRKRAEAERRASEDRLQLALDAGKMGTWDWEIASGALEWSPNMVEMHGLQPGEFQGRFEDFSERVHPDDRERVLSQIHAALNGDEPFQTEYRNLRPDGSVQWLEARGRVSRGRLGQPDHMSGVCIDVTEQVRLRQQIARFAAATVAERDQLQQVIDVIPEGVVIISAEGTVGMSNEAARDIWNDQLSDIDLRIHARYEGPPDPNGTRRFEDLPIWRSIITGEYVLGEQITVLPKGSTEPTQLLLNSAPLRDERGRITAAVTTFQDITAIKDFERQKDEFLQTISHDLKNPLTSIKGNAQLLMRRARESVSSMVPIIERIEGSTDQATALIDELLDITRLQMGRPLDLVRKPTLVNDLVRRTVDEYRVMSDRDRFRVVARQNVIVGSLDEHRVARVLSNLLSNAVKYSDPDSEIVVTTSVPDPDDDWLEISITDHGIGIPASDLHLLFERFRRGSNVEGQIRGSGLGLASSKQIVEQHGGTIIVETEEGRGSTFTVRLPLAIISEPDQGESD